MKVFTSFSLLSDLRKRENWKSRRGGKKRNEGIYNSITDEANEHVNNEFNSCRSGENTKNFASFLYFLYVHFTGYLFSVPVLKVFCQILT